VDTDEATIDRPAAKHPARFHHPEDADAQVALAVRLYRDCFGKSPEGMWPAEGAVSASTVPIYARNGVRWIASDEGVLARSGRWGYDVRDPHVLCRPYRVSDSGESLSVFFRETRLSNAIGFDYRRYGDYRQAGEDFVGEVKERYARKLSDDDDYVLTVILDGENAWGSYEDDGRPFLEALYRLLAKDSEIRTVTFREYLEGNAVRGVSAHPTERHHPVHEVFTGSWIDEAGSAVGVDLVTWIGEDEENRAWELLGRARAFLTLEGATPGSAPAAFEALYIAEGSDGSGGLARPGLGKRRGIRGTFSDPLEKRLPSPRSHTARGARHSYRAPLRALDPCRPGPPYPAGRPSERSHPLSGTGRVERGWGSGAKLGDYACGRRDGGDEPLPAHARTLSGVGRGASFRFECRHEGCPGTELCCDPGFHTVRIAEA
jgi:hypothetical protein